MRRLARELGVDLAAVEGSGRKGRITARTCRRRRGGGGRAAPARPSRRRRGLEPAAVAEVDFAKYGEVERVELLADPARSRRPNLARNWVRIPHVTHHDEADITELEAFRKQLNGEQSDVKVTMVALLLKAVVASLKAFPRRSTRRSTATSWCCKQLLPPRLRGRHAQRPRRPGRSRTSTRRACWRSPAS